MEMVHWSSVAPCSTGSVSLSRLNSVVECAAVVRLVRVKLPVHFRAGTAMSPVRVWEAGPEILPESKAFNGNIYIIKRHLCFARNAGKKQQQQRPKCPDSVEAYHGALSRLRLGFESRSGRFFFLNSLQWKELYTLLQLAYFVWKSNVISSVTVYAIITSGI